VGRILPSVAFDFAFEVENARVGRTPSSAVLILRSALFSICPGSLQVILSLVSPGTNPANYISRCKPIGQMYLQLKPSRVPHFSHLLREMGFHDPQMINES